MLKAVIFDMDGVIVDSEPVHAKAAAFALKKYKVDISIEYFYQFIGSTTYYMCQKMIEDYNIDATPETLLDLNNEMKQYLLEKEGYPVIPYVIDLMKDLHSHGIKLIIASSSMPEAIQRVMQSLHIESYFEGFISGMQVANPKPAPDIFLAACDFLSVSPEECIVIEDSTNGVNAAYQAGITSIGFVNPNSGNQDLSKAAILVEGFDEVDYEFIKEVYQDTHKKPFKIETERLLIREVTLEDIPSLYELYQDLDSKEYPDDFKNNMDLDTMYELHKAYIENVYQIYGHGLWGVFTKKENKLIGRCGVAYKSIQGNPEYEIGYLIGKPYQRKGYAKEGVTAILNYTFHTLNASSLVAIIHKDNNKSIAFAESIGMKLSGEIHRGHRDCYLFRLTN